MQLKTIYTDTAKTVNEKAEALRAHGITPYFEVLPKGVLVVKVVVEEELDALRVLDLIREDK